MLLSRLHCKWRYLRLKKSLGRSSVYETAELASDLLTYASNARVLMFNIFLSDWIDHHFRLLHRRYRGRKKVLDNLWVLYREWKAAVTVKEKANAVFNLVIYSHGVRYEKRDELLADIVEYLRNAK